MTRIARADAGIPSVANATERDALYPNPPLWQKVESRATGTIQRWNGSGWADLFFAGSLSTGTPAVQNQGTQVLALPTALNFVGAGVVASAVGSVGTITIPAVPAENAGGVVVAVPTALKFVGSGVSVADSGGKALVTILAGGGASVGVNADPALGPFAELDVDYVGATIQDLGGGAGRLTLPAYIPPSLGYPDVPPTVANAYDDEFRTASLDPSWTVVETAQASIVTQTDSWLGDWLNFDSNGNGVASPIQTVLQKAIAGFGPGVPMLMVCRMRASVDGNSGNTVLQVELNSGGTFGAGVRFGVLLQPEASTIRAQGYKHGFTWSGANTGQANNPASSIYFAFRKNAANKQQMFASQDGFSWKSITDVETVSWTPANIFIRFLASNISGRPLDAGIDWIRFNDARFSVPLVT